MDPKVSALKDKGNSALQAEKFDEAVAAYTEAIGLDPNNEILYSNRSAAYAKMGQFDMALKDGEKAVEIKPAWSKGYSRKGAALAYLKRHQDAISVYEAGLKHDPANQQLKDGLAECRAALSGGDRGGGAGGGFPNPFAGANLMDKLRNDPRTKDFMNQPDFLMMMRNLQSNPQNLMQHLSDPRVSAALSVLLGIDVSAMSGGAGAGGQMPDDNMPLDDDDDDDMPPLAPRGDSSSTFSHRRTTPTQPSFSSQSKSSSSASDAKKPTGKERPANQTAEQKQAWDEKELGNEAYKKKDFDTALRHYNKASELDPLNVTYMTNKAAALFEQGKYQDCIDVCMKAVEIGRENRADYQLIAKAFARVGNAHAKLGDNRSAKTFLEKSLAEHRVPDVVKRVQEIDKLIKEQDNKAYLNPELAEEERNKGNEAFKKGDYPVGLKHYSEAIKRNPADAKLYSNRAACYTKLLELNLALKDCDECIKLDPNFVKGYLRKGSVLMAMQQSSKAAHAFEKVLELEPENQEAREGLSRATMENVRDPEAARRQAMEDPEIQSIIGDPAMRLILEQMQKDPHAVRDHMKNPEVANRIKKLIDAGLIGMR